MITITRTFEWDMGHRVTNHDSLCKNPHGHRYKMEIGLSGPLITKDRDAQEGMVLDFGRLKRMIHEHIVDRLDHSFMYWHKDLPMKVFAKDNPSLRLLAVPFVPTAECITEYIASELQQLFTTRLPELIVQSVTVYETPNCKAIWQRD